MDIINYSKLNEISSKMVTGTKRPKNPLSFKFAGETESAKTGIRFLTKGWHDNIAYGVARLKLFKANTVADATTWEMGVNLPSTIYETILHLHVCKKGIVLISKKNGENPKVFLLSDINATPVLQYEFLFTPTTDTLNEFNITSHSDGANDYILACQYGMGFSIRNIYLSRDMGATWSVINQNQITTPEDVNAHWHTAKYDPYMGRIWASQGDNTNSAISYSDDFGVTWKRIGGLFQPTMIIPFPDRISLGRDRTTASPGLDHIMRNYDSDLKIVDSFSFRKDKVAHQNYPSHNIVGYGDVAYVYFPAIRNMNEDYIIATGDGGRSWHCVYSGKVQSGIPRITRLTGVIEDGKIAFSLANYGSGDFATPVIYADAIEWI